MVSAPLTDEQRARMAQANVLIQGAGSVGLWLAIQTAYEAQSNSEPVNIVVFERRPAHTREHALWVNPSWFKNKMHPDTDIPGLTDISTPLQIRANVLEQLLMEKAEALGVTVVRSQAISDWSDSLLKINPDNYWKRSAYEAAVAKGKKDWFKAVFRACPTVDRFVGTDGAHSLTREHFFKAEPMRRDIIRRVVQLSLKIDLSSHPNAELDCAYPTAGLFDFKAIAHVDSQEAQSSTLTARFFVDKDTFTRLQNPDGTPIASATNPLSSKHLLEHPLLSTKLKRSLKNWVSQVEKKLSHELGAPFSIDCSKAKLNTILLEHTQAPSFWQRLTRQGRAFDLALEGDAREFTPFYSSLNFSLGTACALAKACAINDPTKRYKAFQNYKAQTNKSRTWLACWLWLKNLILSVLTWFQALTGWVSLRLTKWTFKQASNMHSTNQLNHPRMHLTATHRHDASLKGQFLRQYRSPTHHQTFQHSHEECSAADVVYNVRSRKARSGLNG